MGTEGVPGETASNQNDQGAGSGQLSEGDARKAEIAKIVAEAVAAEVAKVTEVSRREIQSVKDKAKAEVERAARQAKTAELRERAVRKAVEATAPEGLTEVELARYRAEEEARREDETAEAARRSQEEFHNQFNLTLREEVTDLGVDPTDKRIDWAEDAPNYMEAHKRVLKSVAKIKKDSEATLRETLAKEITDKVKRELGIDSVDTSSSGTGSVGDKDFMLRFANGDLPVTKENVARYRKINSGG